MRRLVKEHSLDMAVACEPGRSLGKGFAYGSVPGLDRKVNLMLVELSDRCMEKTREMEREAVSEAGLEEDDGDSVVAWVNTSKYGEDAQNRFDSYCSHLKHILEGWLAIGFARKWSSAYIAARAASDAAPYTSQEWRTAFREKGWGPDIIASGGYRWGKGVPVSPAKGIALGAGAMVVSAYRHAELVKYGRLGATGYRVRRGSSYPCALCDSLCGITWPISVEVLPAHPHCVCYAEPVYDGAATSVEARLMDYPEDKWEHSYISEKGRGAVVTELKRIDESHKGGERQKFAKEMSMCKVIADNGHFVEYLHGINRSPGQTYDVTIDGVKADLKKIDGGAGNIEKYSRKALKVQGADMVVFSLPKEGKEYYKALKDAYRKYGARIMFYFEGENLLREIE